jgi:glycosyltransferase involved in cell wall biosynthesis
MSVDSAERSITASTPKLKIVQVTVGASAHRGGVYTAVQYFSNALRSWSETWVLNFTPDEPDKADYWIPIPIAPGFWGRSFGWVSSEGRKQAHQALEGASFVIIHMPFRFHAGFAADWCRKHSVPYAFVPHGAFDPFVFTYRAWQKRLWLRLVGRKLIRDATSVIFATQGEADKACQLVHVPVPAVVSWPVQIPLVTLTRDVARRNLEQKHGLDPTTHLLLFLGRLHPIKRPVETAAAFQKAGAHEWALVLAGSEDGVSSASLKTGQSVHPVGAIFGADKEELLAGVDALVLFSFKENFSFVVAESLARGIPVLISEEMDLAPVIRQWDCGWVVDARTEAGRIKGIQEVVGASIDDRRARGLRGRKWVLTELTQDRFEGRLRELILDAMKSSRLG